MTPDTTAYMIAGFCVILVGIVAYALSLGIRAWLLRKRSR
jgi:hypothetical protein